MKKRALFAAVGSLLLHAAHCRAQLTVATMVPVGCLTKTVGAATSSSPNNGTLSVPLYPTSVYVGSITSVDGNTAFSSAGVAFFARIKSGANVGRSCPVTANTATQLTVHPQGATDTPPYNLTTPLKAGDTFEVFPANTLGNLFGETGGFFLTSATANAADNLYLWDVAKQTQSVCFNNGAYCRNATSLQYVATTETLPADTAMFVVRKSGFTTSGATFAQGLSYPTDGAARANAIRPTETVQAILSRPLQWLGGDTGAFYTSLPTAVPEFSTLLMDLGLLADLETALSANPASSAPRRCAPNPCGGAFRP